MDRTRLEPSIQEMTSAEVAYDSALRLLADATRRATQQPLDPTVAAQLQIANEELAQARTRVEAARVALDVTRIAELSTLSTADQLLGAIPGHQVIGLFPVGLEARLEAGRLRVRVWPDAISTSTHDPRLMEAELAATKAYWRAEAAARNAAAPGPVDNEASREAWRVLADEIGVTRAAWAAQVLTPTNLNSLGPGVAPVFPTVSLQDEAAPFVPRAGVLPDRWIAIGIRGGRRVVEHIGAAIPMNLAIGLDTTPSETAGLANVDGEPIQLPPRMRWMTDFTLAVGVGMALDIPLAADVDRLDELFVFGVRVTQTPAENAQTLANLFTGHRFSRGFAFVPQNTPTNNSLAGGSGLPSRGERITVGYGVERRPRAFAPGLASNGAVTARAFGMPPNVFAPLPAAGAVPEIAAEPNGFEQEAAGAMQTVLWQVTMGAVLEDFLLLPPARATAVRDYFRLFVRASGPLPTVRVGRQPYGVLPATTITGFNALPGDGIDPRLLPLLNATLGWFRSLRDADVLNGSQNALRYLGRSTHLFAETTQQNAASTGLNRWATLAATLAAHGIADTWRTGRIRGTVEGVPQPVTRAIVDAATPTELAALAAALPGALLTRPLAESVLDRLARQAVLLEWSRLARAVCEATLDEASTVDLTRRAPRQGSDLYLRTVVNAFSARPVGPIVPPVDPGVFRDFRVTARRRDDDEPFDPDEPVEPEDPTGPTRPVPEGDFEINAEEQQRIRAMVGSLAQPLASCPGAARLSSFRQALAQLAKFPLDQLAAETFGMLDICNHRVDAWFTSLASRRLAAIRATSPDGLVIGGWGCLQDVRRADPADAQQRAEFIHTPSLDQAAAAAVLRSGARRARDGGSSHADIDLSSRRVRLARWILEGVRNGRSLNELLGVRFERAVKGTPGESTLGELRARFPGVSGIGVLDGLALQQTRLPPESGPDAIRGVTALDEAMDAVADALTAEAVYQIVKGNPVGALINIEAIAAGEAPPDLHVTETPTAGVRLTHRVALLVPANTSAPGWTSNVSPRSRAEPTLDAWCGFVLGPADRTVLTVDGADESTASLTLASLTLAAIDVVFSGRNHGGELAELVVRAASTATPPLRKARVREDRSWKDLVGLCDAIAKVLMRGEPLRADVFDPPSAMVTAVPEAFGDLPQRVIDAVTALTAVRDALLQRLDPEAAVTLAASFGVRVPGLPIGATPTPEQQDALLAAVELRLAGTTVGTPRDRFRALFGGELPGVVTFAPRDPQMLATATSPPPASLLAGDPLEPDAWLDASGRTHPNAAALAEVLVRQDIVTGASSRLLIAQAPWQEGDRWIATAFTNKSNEPPAGRLSVFMHAPAGLNPTGHVGGLLIDSWTETVPASARDTAMALRFNNASTRAPQVILLAVSPNMSQAWSTTTLVNVLQETLTLARLRVQPATTFSRGGLMPFALLGQRTGTTAISFAV